MIRILFWIAIIAVLIYVGFKSWSMLETIGGFQVMELVSQTIRSELSKIVGGIVNILKKGWDIFKSLLGFSWSLSYHFNPFIEKMIYIKDYFMSWSSCLASIPTKMAKISRTSSTDAFWREHDEDWRQCLREQQTDVYYVLQEDDDATEQTRVY